ncbi:hypothetical protein BDZ97DRAFT_1785143 [Flammula alnicola]|nr:hypothetical protein BDZ97DRAFT_1785143 [Flammula alnicola]
MSGSPPTLQSIIQQRFTDVRSTPGASHSTSIDTTPVSNNSHGFDHGYATVKDREAVIRAELLPHVYYDEHLGNKAFVGKVTSNKGIEQFLKSCKTYDTISKRWTGIKDRKYKKEKELYKPIRMLMASILKHFDSSGKRSVVDTHGKRLFHVEGLPDSEGQTTQLKSSPDITIERHEKGGASRKAAGPKYYAAVASPIEIKTERNFSFDANLVQIAVYARQVFIQQKNRLLVYSLIVTEKHVRLYIFDRSGVSHSTKIDIHQNASDFVRIVLGVASSDDGVIGLDTRIYRRQESLFLDTVDAEMKPVTLSLEEKPIQVFSRRAIRGRGTCCWKAKDNEGKIVVVKDAWRSRDRTPEWKLLLKVKGLAGVGQMIAYDDDEKLHVSTLRGIDITKLPKEPQSSFRDRTFYRLILEYHGKSIVSFETREDVLFAIRDAIAGHQNLWNEHILHRDVSINNILIGQPGSTAGYRGILIDLDMAILIDRKDSLKEADFRTGTRAFQSVNVLESYRRRDAVSHDYLDDLESFFYVLCWVCFGYAGPNKKVEPLPEVLESWEKEEPQTAAMGKQTFFFRPLEESSVTGFFGPIFHKLLLQLHTFFKHQVLRKIAIPKDQAAPCLIDLKTKAVEDYAMVLGFVDEAIKDLAASTAVAGDGRVFAPVTPITSQPMTPKKAKAPSNELPVFSFRRNSLAGEVSPSSRKRGSGSLDDESPVPKRARPRPYAPEQPSSLSISIEDNSE